jgi:hypothetical protein
MRKLVILLVFPIIFWGCGESDENMEGSGTGGGSNPPSGQSRDWLVPVDEIRDGGPGKDGIPSIDNPIFLDPSDLGTSLIKDEDLVVGVIRGDAIRAYPHYILDYHEIVNDKLNEEALTLNYCPLTGTAFGWSSTSDNSFSTFGVSGLLYNANLILYDRLTDSHWSQLKLQCINGSQIGEEPILIPVVETTWKMWRTMFPNSKLMSHETGFARDYSVYPYGPYKTNHEYFVFRAIPENRALPNKLRVHAIIEEEQSKVYRFESFDNGRVVRDSFMGKELLIVGNEDLIVSFILEPDDLSLEFSYAFEDGEILFTDQEGNQWNAFGKAIEGPRKGNVLKSSVSVVSYWFAIAAFYPDPAIYN